MSLCDLQLLDAQGEIRQLRRLLVEAYADHESLEAAALTLSLLAKEATHQFAEVSQQLDLARRRNGLLHDELRAARVESTDRQKALDDAHKEIERQAETLRCARAEIAAVCRPLSMQG